MKLPMSWLAEFVDMTGISNKEYADKKIGRAHV